MVDIDPKEREDKGIFITEFPDLDLLEDEIERLYKEAMDTVSFNGDIKNIYIFGSYARGTAVKGKSDLDVAVVLENIDFGEKKWGLENIHVAEMLTKTLDEESPQMFSEWFRGYDVLTFTINEWNREKSSKSRTSRDEIEGQTGVYNLTKREFINPI